MKVISGGKSGKAPGRNDPCSCGSGAKYKKCCWETDASRTLSISPNLLDAKGFNPASIRMEMQAMMGNIKAIVENKGLSIEKANAYLANRTMDEIADEAREFKQTPQAQALDFAYQAHSARSGKQAVLLAQRAIELDPNCAEAFLILEEHLASDEMESIEYYNKAIAAGESSLGERFFKEHSGHFWGLHETRAYMRAKFQLAQSLWHFRRQSEAIELCWELLRLNPNDNQGVRYVLFDYLLTDNRLTEILKLTKMFDSEGSTHWEFNLALYEFKKDGADSDAATAHLLEADQFNRFVRKYLAGKLKLPEASPSSYSPGSKEEATCYVEDSSGPWLNTEGAITWMLSVKPNEPEKKKPSGEKRKGR